MLGLLWAQPFGSPAPAERLEISDGRALRATPCVLFSPSPVRLGFPRTLAARPRLSARFSTIVNAASPGRVGGHRIRPRPPLYAVLLAGPAVTLSSAYFPDPASIDGAFVQHDNPRIPRRRPLTWPPLSPSSSSCRLTPARLGFARTLAGPRWQFSPPSSTTQPPSAAALSSTVSPQIPHRRSLTQPDLSPTASSCRFTPAPHPSSPPGPGRRLLLPGVSEPPSSLQGPVCIDTD